MTLTLDNAHIPDDELYVIGSIDDNLRWVDGPNLNDNSPRRPRNSICVFKVENGSGGPLDIQIELVEEDGSTSTFVADCIPDALPATGLQPSAYTPGLFVFVDGQARSMTVTWSRSGGTPVTKTFDTINQNAQVVSIKSEGVTAKNGSTSLYVTSSQKIFVNNHTADKYWAHFNDTAATTTEIVGLTSSADWVTTPCPIPATATRVLVNTDPDDTRQGTMLFLRRSDASDTYLVQTFAGTIMSSPYAITPAHDGTAYNVTVHLGESREAIKVWKIGEGPSDAPTLEPGSPSHTFTFDLAEPRWEIHWAEGGDDPKVIVKRPGTPPPDGWQCP